MQWLADYPSAMRVLVVEDDNDVRQAVVEEFLDNGFAVDDARTLVDAQVLVLANTYDCLVLDRSLPDGDGLDQLTRWRAESVLTPALFLTAKDAVDDRVAGFDAGGDDYLVKPFAMAELVVRVRRLCRQQGVVVPSILQLGDLELDSARREVRRAGILLGLTGKEFAVLEMLISQPEVIISKEELVQHCWDERTDPLSNTVEVHIASLRRKLGQPPLIQTVRGAGYRADLISGV